jgi:hypothetical protein
MGKPKAPTPPDPRQTAAASEGTNIGTGVANAFLNNVNQITPYGSLTYNQTGQYGWSDPYSGQSYSIPQFTATQTLSPQQQAIENQNQAAQFNLASLANTQSGRVGNLLSSNLNLADAPAAGAPGSVLGASGDITKTYGPADDFSSDRARVEQSLFDRLNPQLDRQRSQIEQRLADQGIRYGSQAYTSAMDDYNRQTNDLRLGITQTAGQEQQRMMDMAAQRAGFQNAAQQQSYNEQQGVVAAQNAARSQWLTEQYANRNQPINEITALMSGSQVQNPNFVNTPNYQIPTTDTAGLINQNYAQQQQNYQNAMSSWNSMMGGILGLGGSLGGASLVARGLGGGGGYPTVSGVTGIY